MQPTLSPWPGWPGWGKREGYEHGPRLTFTLEGLRNLHDLNINWSKFARPDLAPYNPNIIRHLISFDPERRGNLVLPTIPPNWRINYRELSGGSWAVPAVPPPPPRPSSSWTPGGELVGALILLAVIAVLILRAGERCFALCTRRRRRSEEWPCASVLATQHNLSQIEDIEAFPSQPPTVDLPPPYSECTPANKPHEEPPPPYTACYSAVGPTVHIRPNDKPTSSLSMNAVEAHSSTAKHDDETIEDARESRTEDAPQVNFRVDREGGRVQIV